MKYDEAYFQEQWKNLIILFCFNLQTTAVLLIVMIQMQLTITTFYRKYEWMVAEEWSNIGCIIIFNDFLLF